MGSLTTLGRIIYAAPFAVFGVVHFLHGPDMVPLVPVPGGVVWVYVTGAAMLAAAIGIAANILGRWAGLGLAALLVVYIISIHIPGLANAQTQQISMISLLKDTSLCGGALICAGILGRR
jgi:putative oxidoreductase